MSRAIENTALLGVVYDKGSGERSNLCNEMHCDAIHKYHAQNLTDMKEKLYFTYEIIF